MAELGLDKHWPYVVSVYVTYGAIVVSVYVTYEAIVVSVYVTYEAIVVSACVTYEAMVALLLLLLSMYVIYGSISVPTMCNHLYACSSYLCLSRHCLTSAMVSVNLILRM